MRTNRLILSLVLCGLGALAVAACAKSQTCDDLTARLCADYPDRCGDARAWVDAQYGAADGRVTDADRASADATCAAVLSSDVTLAAYIRRFADSRAPAAVVPPASPRTAAPAPSEPPTTKERIKTAGEIAEEAGKAAEKAGEAFDKLEDALKRDRD